MFGKDREGQKRLFGIEPDHFADMNSVDHDTVALFRRNLGSVLVGYHICGTRHMQDSRNHRIHAQRLDCAALAAAMRGAGPKDGRPFHQRGPCLQRFGVYQHLVEVADLGKHAPDFDIAGRKAQRAADLDRIRPVTIQLNQHSLAHDHAAGGVDLADQRCAIGHEIPKRSI